MYLYLYPEFFPTVTGGGKTAHSFIANPFLHFKVPPVHKNLALTKGGNHNYTGIVKITPFFTFQSEEEMKVII